MGILVLFAFLVGVGIVVAFYFGGSRLPEMMQKRRLEQRLQELSAPPDEAKEAKGGLLKVGPEGPLPEDFVTDAADRDHCPTAL